MLKSTGVVRKVDELGRVVIPVELRRTLEIDERDEIEIYMDGEWIVLKKYEPACVFCGSTEEVKNWQGKNICQSCLNALKELACG
jgi:transcriptional pleiotropic regulator of transition state genes